MQTWRLSWEAARTERVDITKSCLSLADQLSVRQGEERVTVHRCKECLSVYLRG